MRRFLDRRRSRWCRIESRRRLRFDLLRGPWCFSPGPTGARCAVRGGARCVSHRCAGASLTGARCVSHRCAVRGARCVSHRCAVRLSPVRGASLTGARCVSHRCAVRLSPVRGASLTGARCVSHRCAVRLSPVRGARPPKGRAPRTVTRITVRTSHRQTAKQPRSVPTGAIGRSFYSPVLRRPPAATSPDSCAGTPGSEPPASDPAPARPPAAWPASEPVRPPAQS